MQKRENDFEVVGDWWLRSFAGQTAREYLTGRSLKDVKLLLNAKPLWDVSLVMIYRQPWRFGLIMKRQFYLVRMERWVHVGKITDETIKRSNTTLRDRTAYIGHPTGE